MPPRWFPSWYIWLAWRTAMRRKRSLKRRYVPFSPPELPSDRFQIRIPVHLVRQEIVILGPLVPRADENHRRLCLPRGGEMLGRDQQSLVLIRRAVDVEVGL